MTARLSAERRTCLHDGCDALLRSDNTVDLCHRHGDLVRGKAYREAHRDVLSAKAAAYYAANREAVLARCAARTKANPAARKWREVRRKYNLSAERLEGMLEAQEGRCAICSADLDGGKNTHIDHDHECCEIEGSCGECVRSILCSRCNTALAVFGDDPALMRAGADYIERYRKRP